MITSNGARVHDQNDQLMYSKNVPQDLVQAIIDVVKHDKQLFVHLYRNDEWMLNKEDEILRDFHEDSGFTYRVFDVNNAQPMASRKFSSLKKTKIMNIWCSTKPY